MAPTAPRVIAVKIPLDKIGAVIGPKGKMINQIRTTPELTFNEDDGTVYIGAVDGLSFPLMLPGSHQRDRQPSRSRNRRAIPGNRCEASHLPGAFVPLVQVAMACYTSRS